MRESETLKATMCRGLYPHAWAPKPTAHGVALKDGLLYLTSDCSRCGSSKYERIHMKTGAITYRSYDPSGTYEQVLETNHGRTKSAVRRDCAQSLISTRRVRPSKTVEFRRVAKA